MGNERQRVEATRRAPSDPNPDDESEIIDVTSGEPVRVERLRADLSYPDPGLESRSEFFGSFFGSRSYAGGRVRVIGCAPGCLIVSLLVSIILTLLLNAIF